MCSYLAQLTLLLQQRPECQERTKLCETQRLYPYHTYWAKIGVLMSDGKLVRRAKLEPRVQIPNDKRRVNLISIQTTRLQQTG